MKVIQFLFDQFVETTIQHKLLLASGLLEFHRTGALLTYATAGFQMSRQAQ